MTPTTVNTQGGPAIENFTGTLVNRDQIILISGYNGDQLELVLAQLRQMLAGGQAIMQAYPNRQRMMVTAPNAPQIVLSEEAANRLFQVAARQGNERNYLAALMVNPRYGRWASQFVPLAGMLTTNELPNAWGNDIPPEFILLQVEGDDANRRIRRVRLSDIAQAFEQYPTLVLLGEPGSGKSTTLYKQAYDAAQCRLKTEQGYLPLFLPLADYRDHRDLLEFVQSVWSQRLGTSDGLLEHLRAGKLLLLFDALNEMPFTAERTYKRKVTELREFVQSWPGNRVLFTCRSRDYSDPLGFPQVEIERLSHERVRDFLYKYLDPFQTGLGDETWQRLSASPLLELACNPYYISMLTFIVVNGGRWPTNRASLFRSFVRTLIQRESLREHPHWVGNEALELALTELAAAMQPLGEGTNLPRTQVTPLVPGEVTWNNERVKLDAEKVLNLGLAATLLEERMEEEKKDENKIKILKIRFFHHQLQEYFAACALLRRWCDGEPMLPYWYQPVTPREMPPAGNLQSFEPLPPPPSTGWEEPTILATSLAAESEYGADAAAWITAVRALNPALAARCLLEPGIPSLDEEKAHTQQALLQRMTDRRAHVRARLSAGEMLGKLGDPRFDDIVVDGVRVRVPPWVQLPGGVFRMGSGVLDVLWLAFRRFNVTNELPQHSITLPAFTISQYSVTNAEFRCFWEAGGYTEEHYWPTEAARAWRRGENLDQPEDEFMQAWRALQKDREGILRTLRQRGLHAQQIQAYTQLAEMSETQVIELTQQYYTQRDRTQPAQWDDERFNNPSQPVVGVTWYEALAYCTWLDEKLRHAGKLPSLACHIRLPSEAEWEYAARAGRQRTYPWGVRFDPDRANTLEGRLLRTNPVGIYPRGATALGLQEMSGNVWEWTSSLYKPYPYRCEDGRQDLEASGYRVLRGGSWNGNSRSARCAYRGRNVPSYFLNDIGFRVILSLADPGS